MSGECSLTAGGVSLVESSMNGCRVLVVSSVLRTSVLSLRCLVPFGGPGGVGVVGVGVEPGGWWEAVGLGTLLGSGGSDPSSCLPGRGPFVGAWVGWAWCSPGLWLLCVAAAWVGSVIVSWIVDASISPR